MTASILQPRLSARQRIAERTPSSLRKLARMALNYPCLSRTWLGILASLRPVDWRSRKTIERRIRPGAVLADGGAIDLLAEAGFIVEHLEGSYFFVRKAAQ